MGQAKESSFRKAFIVDKDFVSNPVILYLEGTVKGTRFYPKDSWNRPKYYSASLWFIKFEDAVNRAVILKERAVKQAETRLQKLKALSWNVITEEV